MTSTKQKRIYSLIQSDVSGPSAACSGCYFFQKRGKRMLLKLKFSLLEKNCIKNFISIRMTSTFCAKIFPINKTYSLIICQVLFQICNSFTDNVDKNSNRNSKIYSVIDLLVLSFSATCYRKKE